LRVPDLAYQGYGDPTKNLESIVRQNCQGDDWKMKVKDFKTKFPKLFKILTDGMPSKEL
jgi:hypothetical protein